MSAQASGMTLSVDDSSKGCNSTMEGNQSSQSMLRVVTPFLNQQVEQGVHETSDPTHNAMLSSLTPQQRQDLSLMPPDKVQDILNYWQIAKREGMTGTAHQDQIGIDNQLQGQFSQLSLGAGNPIIPRPTELQQVVNLDDSREEQGPVIVQEAPNAPRQMVVEQERERPPFGEIPTITVTGVELAKVRDQKPKLAHISDDRLRNMILDIKRRRALQQQQQQEREQCKH